MLYVAEFSEMKEQFLDKVVATCTIQMEVIPPEMILNWDQTGIKTVPSSIWTMEQQGTKCVDLVGACDKRLITMYCSVLWVT